MNTEINKQDLNGENFNPNEQASESLNADSSATNYFEARTDLGELQTMVQQIKDEIGKTIVGQHNFLELLIVAVLADGHVLIEGVPGVAKTLTAKLLAKTISTDFARIQFTPDLMPSDIL
ncbi:MAG: AAA family ATPase, partial [Chitinophagales bacterium]